MKEEGCYAVSPLTPPRVKTYLPLAVTGELTAGIGTKVKDLIEGCAVLSVLADDTSEFYWATAILDGGRIAGVTLTKVRRHQPHLPRLPRPRDRRVVLHLPRPRLPQSPLQAHRRPDRRPVRGRRGLSTVPAAGGTANPRPSFGGNHHDACKLQSLCMSPSPWPNTG